MRSGCSCHFCWLPLFECPTWTFDPKVNLFSLWHVVARSWPIPKIQVRSAFLDAQSERVLRWTRANGLGRSQVSVKENTEMDIFSSRSSTWVERRFASRCPNASCQFCQMLPVCPVIGATGLWLWSLVVLDCWVHSHVHRWSKYMCRWIGK